MSSGSLITDLGALISKYPAITGLEFLNACERAARGHYPENELVDHEMIAAFADALRIALRGKAHD